MGQAMSPLSRRLWAAGIVGGVCAIVVLAVLVLKYGRFDPSPPSLEKNPNPAIPGELLFVDEDGCVVRALASGESRSRVDCPGAGIWGVSWIDREKIAIGLASAADSGRPTWTEFDLATGSERDTGIIADYSWGTPRTESPQGEQVVIEEDGGVILVAGVVRTKIASFEVPRHRQPQLVTWSPDGEWMLLTYWVERDEARELWILSKDGRTKGTIARLDAFGPVGASWWIDGRGYLPAIGGLPAGR